MASNNTNTIGDFADKGESKGNKKTQDRSKKRKFRRRRVARKNVEKCKEPLDTATSQEHENEETHGRSNQNSAAEKWTPMGVSKSSERLTIPDQETDREEKATKLTKKKKKKKQGTQTGSKCQLVRDCQIAQSTTVALGANNASYLGAKPMSQVFVNAITSSATKHSTDCNSTATTSQSEAVEDKGKENIPRKKNCNVSPFPPELSGDISKTAVEQAKKNKKRKRRKTVSQQNLQSVSATSEADVEVECLRVMTTKDGENKLASGTKKQRKRSQRRNKKYNARSSSDTAINVAAETEANETYGTQKKTSVNNHPEANGERTDPVNSGRRQPKQPQQPQFNAQNNLPIFHARMRSQKQREEKKEFPKKSDQEPTPNDFRELEILPKRDDLFRKEQPYLQQNVIKGRYDDLEHYLDVHFRLLLEDFQAPLREGIKVLVARAAAAKGDGKQKKEKIDGVYVYEGVRVLNPFCARDGMMFRLTFDVSKVSKFVVWENSKRLNYGSLLCLSKDNFQTLFFATVANSDARELRKGKLDINIMLQPDEKVNLETTDIYVMAESRAYFEAYRHVLTGLQETIELPFEEHLIECKTEVSPPGYLISRDYRKEVKYDFSCIKIDLADRPGNGKNRLLDCNEEHFAPALKPNTWPLASSLGLNESQFKALETALTKELAIVQGPPGTGKTYVGLKIAKLLLENKKKTDFGPILVVCYTNHALDQFLEGIYEFHKSGIVRIGGRSSSENMKKCLLSNFVQQNKKKSPKSMKEAYERLDAARDQLQTVIKKLDKVNQKLLPKALICEVVTKDILQSLLEGSSDGRYSSYNEALLTWLGLFSDDAEANEAEQTVLVQSDEAEGELLTDEKAEKVQLANRDFSIAGIVKTTTGGGIISRFLRKPRISQTLFISKDGYLILEDIQGGKSQLLLEGVTKINDDEWHEVVMTYEEAEGRICLYVDKVWQAEKDECAFYQYEPEKENIVIGSSPISEEIVNGGIVFRELVYLPNAITIHKDENSGDDAEDSDSPGVEVEYDADFIRNQRIIEDDDDAERNPPEPERKLTILDRILGTKEGTESDWTVVKNEKKALSKYQSILKRELTRKDCMSIKDSNRVKNVWDLIKQEDRWQLYRRWMIAGAKAYRRQIANMEATFKKAFETCDDVRSARDAELLKSASVIGMTTSGAARRSKLLKGISAQVVIVEEAAEVLESHIITSLTKECKHLILIGDHQQLRPKPNVYELELHFNLDVSLFERMINNGLHYEGLKEQHRMRPEIARLMRHIYPQLQDHESVFQYEIISGVKHNIFFVDHDELEVNENDTTSHVNRHEAKFAVALCKYFLQQGYHASQITILTPYTGQLREIQKCARGVLPKPPKGEKNVRVTSVDNFQGEENDIILLSLVRSNIRRNIGFLKISNRVCVALSRAKKGFYCIGNAAMCRTNELWRKILDDLKLQGQVGQSLTLCCQMHPDKAVEVKTAEDFQRAPNGGCTEPCAKTLSCGHTCPEVCHPRDQEHEEQYRCRKPCQKFPCDLHPHTRCRNRCTEPCSPCKEIVKTTLPKCQHKKNLPCHIAQGDLFKVSCTKQCPVILDCGHQCPNYCSAQCGPCTALIEKPLPHCKHKVKWICSEDLPADLQCESECPKTFPCGHRCPGKCSRPCGECQERIKRDLPNCRHEVEMRCSDDLNKIKCPRPCSKLLACGHPCTKTCGQPCDTACKSQCKKKLKCKHKCPNLCSEPCGPCTVKVDVVLPKCNHQATIVCSQNLEEAKCYQACEEILGCGHPCTGYCSEKCPPCPYPCERSLPNCYHQCQKKCYEECIPCMKKLPIVLERCKHRAEVPCSVPESDFFCRYPCHKLLPCKHKCTKMCSEPCGPCQTMVLKEFQDCGHTQTMPCSTNPEMQRCLSPCSKQLNCGHACPRKCFETECGPCVSEDLVTKILQACGHENKVPCCQDPSTFSCKRDRPIPLPCGHSKKVPCSSKIEALRCRANCNNRGNAKCGPVCAKCLESVWKNLRCGHKMRVACYKIRAKVKCLVCSGLFIDD